MRPYHKERTESEIKRQLSNIITYEVSDPNISNVTVTSVKMSVDGKYAKVFVSILKENEDEKQKVMNGLERAQKFIRTMLAKKIKMRHSPELHFKIDDSLETGFRIEKILREIDQKSE